MIKKTGLIGKVYPFFISNPENKSYYLYQVVSPKLSDNYSPLLTLEKISERTLEGEYCATPKTMFHGDLIATLMKSRKKMSEGAVKYLEKEVFNRPEESKIAQKMYNNGINFPLFDYSTYTLRSIIIGLRDNIRWNRYRITSGKKIDMLLSPTQYGVFKIKGDKESIWLELDGVYDNLDIEQQNPLNVDTTKVQYPKEKFFGDKKSSELNRAIRSYEWKSFENNTL